jgi:glycosyltransferase involved in cell wall biosynthesis
MKKPKLSVGLPVYNGERYLQAALESLLSQDFEDFELIISDNGSDDGTPRLCEEYARKDARVRYFRNEVNRGATWNFDRVVELANGTYFKWAFCDDLCDPTMFSKCLDEFDRSDSSVVLAYPRSEFIYEAGEVLAVSESPRWDHVATECCSPHRRLACVIRWLLHGQAIFGIIRLDALRRTRPSGCVAMDWVKVAELAVLGKIIEVPEILLQVRIHKGNSIFSNKTWRELLAWHDPVRGKGGRPLPFSIAVMLEYLKSVYYIPMPAQERIPCFCVVFLVWPFRVFWLKVQKQTGPARIWLQARTGWKFLSAVGGST